MTFSLEGIKVIETASVQAGPMAGRFLADWGADVIHVDSVITGEEQRDPRRLQNLRGRVIPSDINYIFENHFCSKRGIALDLSQERGREILHNLLKKADVYISNFRPRELKKFDLEYDTLSRKNPRLICANLTGWGKKGPDRNMPGVDYIAFWARAGILHVLCTPDMAPPLNPLGMGDRTTSLAFVCGIMAALFVRERSGVGQEVDVSIFNTGVFVNAVDVGGSLVTGQDRQNVNREDVANALMGSYQTKDGRWLCLIVGNSERYWARICQALERQDLEHDPRFESLEARIENHAALFHLLQEIFLTKTLADWRVRLTEAGIPWGPVQNLPEVTSDPQARANDFFIAYDHPTYGKIEVVANPIKLGKTPAKVRMPAPGFGQHTEEVLLENGYTREDIVRLKEQGVIA